MGFKVGDSVICEVSDTRDMMRGVTYPMFGQTYTIRGIIEEVVDGVTYTAIVLNEIRNSVIHTKSRGYREPHFNVNKFKLNITETRHNKLKQLDI